MKTLLKLTATGLLFSLPFIPTVDAQEKNSNGSQKVDAVDNPTLQKKNSNRNEIDNREKEGKEETFVTLKGNVKLSGKKPEPKKFMKRFSDKYKNVKKEEEPYSVFRIFVDDTTKGIKNVLVYVKSVDQVIEEELPPKTKKIKFVDYLFQPSTFVLLRGGKLMVQNTNDTIENFQFKSEQEGTTEVNVNAEPKSDTLSIGQVKAGFYTLKNALDPEMKGWGFVTDHHAYDMTNKQGAFSFKVPPGEYTLVVRLMRLAGKKKEVNVTVTEDGLNKNISLQFPKN